MAARYRQINQVIKLFQPIKLIETGTWNGDRAVDMAGEVFKYSNYCHYTGFDLFEDADPITDSQEMNVKKHNSISDVYRKLHAFAASCRLNGKIFEFHLIKGNTRETIKDCIEADFAYIDGGHSIQTIGHESAHIKSRVFVFDDYYTGGPDISKFGCNFLELSGGRSYAVLPIKDPVAGGGNVQMMMAI